MKFPVKVLSLSVLCAVLLFISATVWPRCDSGLDTSSYSIGTGVEQQKPPDPTSYREIPCVINDEFTVPCRRESDQVFIPFSFIHRYFEITGEFDTKDDEEVFLWQHSYSKVYQPQGKYTPHGIFMSFEHYNVEIRDRVKCISGMEGVPLSTQWGPQGYYYPIQIAQYGLSHYSKYLVDKSRTTTTVEEGRDGAMQRWSVVGNKARVATAHDPEIQSQVVQFYASDSWQDPGAKLQATSTSEFFLALDFKFASNGSFSVYIQPKGKHPDTYCIRYVLSQTVIATDGDFSIIIGMGERTGWSHITRDLATDFQKGLNLMYSSKHNRPRLVLHKVVSVVFRGHGWVDNVTLSSNAHLAQFYYAANWLVLHQDYQGGWPIMVTRKLTKNMAELPPGWYSAMAQGQAMSLLVRAYIRTQNHKYLDAALRATTLYSIASSKGGVMALFADKYVWYEEYPTTPSSFVLNGFIYSLIGLYDLKMVAPADKAQEAASLYEAGIASLRTLLPLYDTGSGSTYDLRHVGLGSAPNLARWDYHATHINQLLLLATIADDAQTRAFYESTAKRWMGYMKGKRAAHN